MLRLFGLMMIAGIVCLGCKPPEPEAASSGDAEATSTSEAAAATATLPPPATTEKPKETTEPEEKPTEESATEPEQPMSEETPAPPMDTPTETPQPEESTETVAAEASASVEMTLSADNTLIQFVGTHVGDKPDPRTGKFGKFSGTAKAADGKLTSVAVTIDTASLETEIEKLTNHLKSPDFFDVRAHPEAKFVSKKIEYGEDGKAKITGDLTMLGTTKSITFPAKVTVGEDVRLDAEFVIDRVEFGMDYSPDKVDKDVTMTIKVGK